VRAHCGRVGFSSVVIRLLRAAVIAIAGFVLISGLAAHFLPAHELPYLVREKAAYLSEHGDEYDAIFLGSSRIQNHIIPEQFDRCMTDAGMPMRSFNFGISSMHSPEDEYVLDLILARPHARLRWIFIEIDFFHAAVQTDQSGTVRGAYWHDWPRFSLLCQCLSVVKKKGIRRNIQDAFSRWNDIFDHAQLFGQRSANTGRGAQMLAEWLFDISPVSMDWDALGKARDGWTPAIEKENDIAERRSGRLGTILKERIADPPSRDATDAAGQKALTSLLGKIVGAGAKPVIIIPPRLRKSYFYPAPELARRFPIINLCEPARFPDLYREDLRVDLSHLNGAGAEIFTRVTAEQFIEAIRKPR
jgi:hypothetical protein